VRLSTRMKDDCLTHDQETEGSDGEEADPSAVVAPTRTGSRPTDYASLQVSSLETGWPSDAVHWRCASVSLAQVVVEQLNIPSGYFERGWTVAEDALQREHITTVSQKRSGEGVA
jgi:hypothetical protein